jgi:hypothetical protein
MTYTLRCWQRLGDILLCLPAAQYLHIQGHTVFIECYLKYHAIFQCVDYAVPVEPRARPEGQLLVMGVHPHSGGTLARYLAYRRGGLKWQDFVYTEIPELNECPRVAPVFTRTDFTTHEEYGLPRKFVLLAPDGYSQIQKHSEGAMASLLRARQPGLPIFTLTEHAGGRRGCITAVSLAHLPQIISWAERFSTINSAPAIIAAGLGRAYTHYPQEGWVAQDDTAYLASHAEVIT